MPCLSPIIALLPDDPAVLKQLVVQLLEELQKERAPASGWSTTPPAAEKNLRQHEREVRSAAGRVVRCPARRGADCPEHVRRRPPSSPTPKNRDRHGRGRIPDNIQREEVVHDLTDAEKAALGGAENLVELPSERSEQLDWRPSTLFVIVHVRKKYARKEQLPESGLTLSEQNVVRGDASRRRRFPAVWPGRG